MTEQDFFDQLQANLASDPPEDRSYAFRYGWRSTQVEACRELIIRWFDQQAELELPI